VRRSDQRRAAVVALYQADVTGRPLEELLDENAKPFTRELIEGVARERDKLDELIARHSVGWTLDRIAPLERNILRVALYELLHRPDIPTEVAIDEAVEAAKELCSAEAPPFVNGILGAVQREEVPSR
jgi:transcription antitermination protein NusB